MKTTFMKPIVFFWFALTVLVGFGVLSVFLGKELCWDLANYHYSNPFIFFHPRQDFWPVSFIHQYFNPTIDFLGYFLINHFNSKFTEFTLGAVHGLNFILIFLIALELNSSIFLALSVATLGMLGATAFPGIGSFQNDNLVSIFILIFILLSAKALKDSTDSYGVNTKLLFWAGLSLGAGVGLKLTAGPFLVSGCIVLFLIVGYNNFKAFTFLTLGIVFGLIITGGYWFLHLAITHHNPFFPFFNGIFHSADFQNINWLDNRFFPKNIFEAIFFPFYFSLDGRTSDAPFQDLRFPLLFIALFILSLKLLIGISNNKRNSLTKPEQFIILFFLVSYLFWEVLFSNSRYFVAMEMLAPLLIFISLRNFFSNSLFLKLFTFSIFSFLVLTTFPSKMIRAPWYEGNYFNIKFPNSVAEHPEALTLVNYSMFALGPNPRPQNYLVPFLPSQWQFIGIPFLNNKFTADPYTDNKIKNLISDYKLRHANPIFFILTSDYNFNEMLKSAEHYGLGLKQPCEFITSDRQRISNQQVMLCLMH